MKAGHHLASDGMAIEVTDETRDIVALKPDPQNPKRHPESQIADIAASIDQFGYVQKIVCRPNSVIIAGHGTWEAQKRRGVTGDIAVRVVHGLTDAQYHALMLALNKLPENGSYDEALLADLLREVTDADIDAGGLGFSDKERDRLLNGADDLEVKEIETGEVEDEFWISIRGPLKHQAEALRALEAAMKGYDGVTVDLGTIALG